MPITKARPTARLATTGNSNLSAVTGVGRPRALLGAEDRLFVGHVGRRTAIACGAESRFLGRLLPWTRASHAHRAPAILRNRQPVQSVANSAYISLEILRTALPSQYVSVAGVKATLPARYATKIVGPPEPPLTASSFVLIAYPPTGSLSSAPGAGGRGNDTVRRSAMPATGKILLGNA